MKLLTPLVVLCTLLAVQQVLADKEIVGILDEATDLTAGEINALRPLFEELQTQYDHILKETTNSGSPADAMTEDLYASTQLEFEQYFVDLVQATPSYTYDTSLPTVEQLSGTPTREMTQAELEELLDMQSILKEALDEAQLNINEIVKQALQMEVNLLKLNKPKILAYIYKALRRVYKAATRVGRAAYCTYSHIPELNTSLHHIYDGVDCYTYSIGLIVRIQNETVQTVDTIKRNVYELADIYKKAASKHSILGKIVTIILNATKIVRDIRETYAVATQTMDALQNELPGAVNKTLDCGTNFLENVPQVVASVTNVTSCILFVDNDVPQYDFMKPEASVDSN